MELHLKDQVAIVTGAGSQIGYGKAIALTLAKEGCDVIVLGTHGKGFLSHAFLGSVSNAILHRTHKPVLIVPLPPEKVSMDWDGI